MAGSTCDSDSDSDSEGFCVVPAQRGAGNMPPGAEAGASWAQPRPCSPSADAAASFQAPPPASPSTPGSVGAAPLRLDDGDCAGGDSSAGGASRGGEALTRGALDEGLVIEPPQQAADEHLLEPPAHSEAEAEAEASEASTCPICERVFPGGPQSMMEHYMAAHCCAKCDRCDVLDMAAHEEEHRAAEAQAQAAATFACCNEGCGRTFQTERDMLEHLEQCAVCVSPRNRPDDSARASCPLCGKVYSKKMSRKERQRHEAACTGGDQPPSPVRTRASRAAACRKEKEKEAVPQGGAGAGAAGGASTSTAASPGPERPLKRLRRLASVEPPPQALGSGQLGDAAPESSPAQPGEAEDGVEAQGEAPATAEPGSVCCLCGLGDQSAQGKEGALRCFAPPGGRELWCHEPCAAFCKDMPWLRCSPLDSAILAAAADKARAGGYGECLGCGRGGTAMTCLSCHAALHFPCAREMASKHQAVFVFSDIDKNTGASTGGVLCSECMGRKDAYRDHDGGGPMFSGTWFERVGGGWRARAHGLEYSPAVPAKHCQMPPELAHAEDVAAAAAALPEKAMLLGVVMSKEAARLCRANMSKWEDTRKTADEALDAHDALYGAAASSPGSARPARSLEEQFSRLEAPAALDVVNLEARRSPGGLCPTCGGGPGPCACVLSVRQAILENIPFSASRRIQKETGRIEPSDLPERLRPVADGDLLVGKVDPDDPRKHLATRGVYTVTAARSYVAGDVVIPFKGYLCTQPEFRHTKCTRAEGFPTIDDWQAYLDEGSHDLVSDAEWQETNNAKLTMSSYLLSENGFGPKRPEFCGNEAVLIRQPIVSVSRAARAKWNDRHFDTGKLEQANVDSVMHFHRHDKLGNVACMEFAICGFPFTFVVATAPIEKGQELLMLPILDFWKHWNGKSFTLLQHPALAKRKGSHSKDRASRSPATPGAVVAEAVPGTPALAATPRPSPSCRAPQPAQADLDPWAAQAPASASPSPAASEDLGGSVGAGFPTPSGRLLNGDSSNRRTTDLGDTSSPTAKENGFMVQVETPACAEAAPAPGPDSPGPVIINHVEQEEEEEWGYASPELVLKRRKYDCLWSLVALNEGPGIVTGESAMMTLQQAGAQAGGSGGLERPMATAAAARRPQAPSAPSNAAPQLMRPARGNSLRRANVDPWADAKAVRSRAGGLISRIRSREGADKR